MSERRLVLAVVGVLVAALGAATALLALLGLRHPVSGSGDLGTPTDFGSLLTNLVWVGVLLAVIGGGTAVSLVRHQLRAQPVPDDRD